MPLPTSLYQTIRTTRNIQTFSDTWTVLHNIEVILPIVLQSVLIIAILVKHQWFMSLNWLLGYRVAVGGLALIIFFFAAVDGGFVLYMISAMSSVLALFAQVLVMILTMNSCFSNENGFVLAWIPKMSTFYTVMLYPIHCLPAVWVFVIFGVCLVGIGVGVSFWRLTALLNSPRNHPRDPQARVCHLGWFWFLVFPFSFFCLGGGILLSSGFPCPRGNWFPNFF